jgi:hypothetical protein
VYLTEEQSNEDDFWQNDTSGQSQIFVNRAAKLDRVEAFLIPQMLATLACSSWYNRRLSVFLPAQQTSNEMGINENGNCAKPALAIDQARGHQSQLVVQENSKLWDR